MILSKYLCVTFQNHLKDVLGNTKIVRGERWKEVQRFLKQKNNVVLIWLPMD